MKSTVMKNLEELKKEGMASLFPGRIRIAVGSASCGLAAGAGAVFDAVQAGIKEKKIKASVQKTGCIGLCYLEPILDIMIPGRPRLFYGKVTAESVTTILNALKQGCIPEGAFCRMAREDFMINGPVGEDTGDPEDPCWSNIPFFADLPFNQKQLRIALRNCGLIDPENIREYIAGGGYQALSEILHKKTPAQVVAEVERSGLRGRGGAGFLTGLKWKTCRKVPADKKYIVCNADEGDPGAYMDRSILEGDPHSVIEGMAIAAYAVGAEKGFIYVRDEYPYAIERLQTAIKQAVKFGILGENILDTGFSFDIEISRGAGAFVCGEETALIRSIEGDCGEPRQKPPYPAERGLWGKPTVINNVETLALVAVVMDKGVKWFKGLGTEKSKGTKVFSLVGQVNRTGLVEVPMGTSLRDIIYGIGGGIPKDRAFKAVQTGGPSGGCIPAELIDLPVDYEALAGSGSIMGSGGLIVMDEKTCMVDVARYFLGFLEKESCGKCTPCRVGVKRMHELLDDICCGKAVIQDLTLLENMARNVRESALCGLGQTAPNPVLSTLKYFKDEYLAHILLKKCPAGVCKPLITYAIDAQKCTGCGACLKACPVGAIKGEKKKKHKINTKKCITCGACQDVCAFDAVLA